MRLTVNSIRLQQAIALVAASTNARASLPVLGGVLLHAEEGALTLTGTDLDTAAIVRIEADVAEPGRIVVPADRLGAIAQRFPAAEAQLRLKDTTTLALVCGRTRMDLRGMDYKDFPLLPQVDGDCVVTLMGRDFGIISSRVAFAVAAASDSRDGMKGVGLSFEKGTVRAVGTNGRQVSELVLRADGSKAGGEMLLLHPNALDRVGKMFGGEEPVRVHRSANHLALRSEGRTFICRLMGDEFPWAAYKALVKGLRKKVDRWAECDRNALMSMIQRMQVVAAAVDISPVRLALGADRIECYTTTPDAGEAEEELEVDRDGDNVTFILRSDFLLEVLRRVPGPRVRMEMTGDPNSAVFFLPGEAETEGTGSILMLTPISTDAPQVAGWKPVGT